MADPAVPSFPMLLQRFFVEHLGQHRAVSAHTVAAYRDTFRLLLQFAQAQTGKTPTRLGLTDLDAKLVLSFLDHLETERHNSVRSRNARLAAVRSFLHYAARHDVAALPVIGQVLAIPAKRFDQPLLGYLSREEMQAILAAPDAQSWAGQRDRAFFSLLYNTGARVSEACRLRLRDVPLDGTASVHLRGKGRKQRSVPLWRSTAALLVRWKRQLKEVGDDDLLFPTRSGGMMTRSNVAQRLALAVAAAAEHQPRLLSRSISPHTIRHTTAMHLLQSGVDITVIALWLGHESPTTTHMYVEADLATKERALAKLQPLDAKLVRYRASDPLLHFLQGL